MQEAKTTLEALTSHEDQNRSRYPKPEENPPMPIIRKSRANDDWEGYSFPLDD